MRREASTRREKKLLKLNVSQQTLELMVAVKHREGHGGLSQTLDYLLECDRGRFFER